LALADAVLVFSGDCANATAAAKRDDNNRVRVFI
jgi:hypothetical protein